MLNLLKLCRRPMGTGEWNKLPLLKGMFLEPIPALRLWLEWLGQTVFVCMPAIKCVYFCPRTLAAPNLVCVCCNLYGSHAVYSRTERGIRILRESLGTSGCDWQEKKGPLCSGNWQRKPDPTQCNPAQCSTEPANTGKQHNCAPHSSLLILILSQFS